MTPSNPLLATEGPIPYDQIKPEHVLDGVRAWLTDATAQLVALEADVPADAAVLLERLDNLGRRREYAWAPVQHLMAVMNSTELREVYGEVQGEVVAFGLRAGQSVPLYDALKAIREGDGWEDLSSAKQRIVSEGILSARHAGVGLEGESKTRFDAISKDLAAISTEFGNHVLDATRAFELIVTAIADTDGWPDTLRRMTSDSYSAANDGAESSPEAGPWRLTLDVPVFMGVMRHGRKREHRRELLMARLARASDGEFDNRPLVEKTLALRREMATLLGYSTYAELSLSEKMAPDVAAVRDLMDKVLQRSKPAASKELEELRAFAKAQGHEGELAHWDVSFWSERLREQRFEFTEEELRPYFPLPRVLDGLFGVCTALFGITVEEADGEVPIWHDDVRYFRIRAADGSPIGSFTLDPYTRPGLKRGGAWMGAPLGRRTVDGKLVLPVASLQCNMTPPAGGRPSLMTFGEVSTLFHEFGHGLQHMLTEVDDAAVAGINGVEWDAVEIASQFMENWLYHKPTLLGMTRHVDTGEPLPDELFDKLVAARTFQSGMGLSRQVVFGKTDLELHCEYEGGEGAFDVYQRHATEVSAMAPLPESPLMLCSFGHLFGGGYAAGYYSYLWSDVLSADAFSAFEEAGLDDSDKVAELGERYRSTILALGGSKPPAEVFRAFRGRDPDPSAMLRHRGLGG